MKKQVTFAEGRTVYKVHRDQALTRRIGMNEKKTAATVNFSESRTHRLLSTKHEPQLQEETTLNPPNTMTAGPILHSALTPAQKEYLYSISATFSSQHARTLITQHYLNVMHRCVPPGQIPGRDDLVEPDDSDRLSEGKHNEKVNTRARNSGKFLSLKNPKSRRKLGPVTSPCK